MKCATVAVILVACALARADQKPAAKGEVVVPKSVFVDEPNSGIDPFFPNSKRRTESPVQVVSTNTAPPINVLLDQLLLKGISGLKGQPLALINSKTLAPGEAAEFPYGGHSIKVRCREIRERSVIIELDPGGETRELKLRNDI